MIDNPTLGQFLRRIGLALFGLAGVVLFTGRVQKMQHERADDPAAQLHASFSRIEKVSSFRRGDVVTAVVDDEAVRFPFDSHEILPRYHGLLDRIGTAIAEQVSGRVVVHGHTDNVGSADYNQLLSYQPS